MTKLTPQELDARIVNMARTFTEQLNDHSLNHLVVAANYLNAQKQLILDCIEAVTPKGNHYKHEDGSTCENCPKWEGFNKAIAVVSANTKKLLD